MFQTRRPPSRHGCRTAVAALAGLALAMLCPAALDASEALSEQTLSLREALHHDPTLEAPLDALLDAYREAGELESLSQLYRDHLEGWPDDVGAHIVLLRIAIATHDPEIDQHLHAALQHHPDHAYLHYLRHEIAEAAGDADALDALARAIELEDRPDRRRRWIDRLLTLATREDRPALIDEHLQLLARLAGDAVDDRLEAAQQMLEHDRPKLATKLMHETLERSMPAETGVTAQLLTARAEAAAGDLDTAGDRLDTLLERLAPDYWRRTEIMRQRVAWLGDDDARQAMIDAARARVADRPDNEAAAVELAELLQALDRRQAAMEVLLEAGERLPRSRELETRTLDLLEALRDEAARADYLARRLEQQSDRRDLRLLHARSLYTLGRSEQAHAAMEQALAGLDEGQRLTELIDTARLLRRSLAPSDAAALLEQAMALDGGRFELRRELAELYQLLDRAPAAAALFDDAPTDVAIEHLLDAVDFLIEQEHHRRARALLEARLAETPDHLELHLRLLEAQAGLEAWRSANQTITHSRPLADTTTHYRRWLDAAATFHGELDTLDRFLEAERSRIDADRAGWDDAAAARRSVFIDALVQHRHSAKAAAMLQADLERDPPEAVRRVLLRQLVAVLPNDDEHREQHLNALMEHDPASASMARAHLAASAMDNRDTARARTLLEQVAVSELDDAALLRQLQELAARVGLHEVRQAATARLPRVSPGNFGHWQQWFDDLAEAGQEHQLRVGLRQVLAGVNELELDDADRATVRQQLRASYWRSIRQALEQGADEPLLDALAMVDALDRLAGRNLPEAAWATWVRALVLNRRGEDEARDEALATLERLGERLAAQSETGDVLIALPDGMAISLSRAAALARADYVAVMDEASASALSAAVPADAQGPSGDAATRLGWALRTRQPVAAVGPAGDGRVLVTEHDGSMTAVDGVSGKRLWRWEPERSQGWSPGQNMAMSRLLIARPAVDVEGGRVYVAGPQTLYAVSLESGELVWRTPLPDTTSDRHTVAGVRLAVHAGQVIVFDPQRGRLQWYDTTTGKLTRERRVLPASDHATWQTSGMSVHDGRLLVYADEAALVDAETGAVAWMTQLAERPVRPGAAAGGGGGSPFASVSRHMVVSGSYGMHTTHHTGGRNPGPPRVAVLEDGRMTAFVNQSITLLGTDLLTTEQREGRYISGWFAGMAGDEAVFVLQSQARLVNVRTGDHRFVQLSDLNMPQDSNEPLGTVVDGAMLHVVNRRQVVGYDLVDEQPRYTLSLERVRSLALPDNQEVRSGMMLRGVTHILREGNNSRGMAMLTTSGYAADGRVYVLPDPWHVVAVAAEEEAADE
ncbi:MAG: PQQ-binding-like beta-propeller repeat protein [Phycisphaeraceae bacterium]